MVSASRHNTGDLLNDPKIREPWPESFVEWNAPRDSRILGELAGVLNTAKDEKPLQEFCTRHPTCLPSLSQPHCCGSFRKRVLVVERIPHFLYCDKNSLGFEFTLVELESPTTEATDKDESVSPVAKSIAFTSSRVSSPMGTGLLSPLRAQSPRRTSPQSVQICS